MMKWSPSGTTVARASTQMRAWVRPRHRRIAAASMTSGTKRRLPLTYGITASKNGLLNEPLMNRNRLVSSVCSQCIGGQFNRKRPDENSIQRKWSSNSGYVNHLVYRWRQAGWEQLANIKTRLKKRKNRRAFSDPALEPDG